MNPQLSYMIAQERIAHLSRMSAASGGRKPGGCRAPQSDPPEKATSVGGCGVG